MHAPSTTHLTAVKRVLRYLKGTAHHGILIRRHSPLQLHAFNRTSTTAYIVFLGANTISWSSKKQKTVARSSTEAEYRTVASTAAKVNWLQNLLQELRLSSSSPPTIFCDNVGATYVQILYFIRE